MHHGSPHIPLQGAESAAQRTLVAVGEAVNGKLPASEVSAGATFSTGPTTAPATGTSGTTAGPHVNGNGQNGSGLNGHGSNGNGVRGHVSTETTARQNGVLEARPANGHAPRIQPQRAPKAERTSAAAESGKLFRLSRRTHSLLGVQVLSCGSYAPEHAVSNEELENQYGYEKGWIEQRTGILSRRYAAPDTATSDLCVEAARIAIERANVNPADIDLVIVGTFTPDYLCPSTACLVQDRLGLDAAAMDLQAACSGFMYSMVTGAQYVASGNSKLALVIGADVMSRIVNPADQRTAPLFGDGAGAVLMARGEPHQGLICYQMGSDGGGGSLLVRTQGGTKNPVSADDVANSRHMLQMDGRSVFKWAVRAVTETIDLVLSKSGMSVHDVSLFVLHQANQRIISYAMEQLGIPSHKVYNNLQNYGNTSAASIPLVLDEAQRAGRIQSGDTILMSGFGAGLSWGTALFRW
ncbi:MAG: ketoacyl-ACP synthase III [Planctomycetaceae bacterium]|nr:ketoacyl-ACP synthase III [Planctomycetaceae bacterium]